MKAFKIKLFQFFCGGLLLTAFEFCSEKKSEQIIPEAIFENVLIDIYLAEAYINQNKYANKDSAIDTDFYYKEIFEKYKIDKTILNENYIFYGKNPEKLEEIYDNVLDSLNRLEISYRPKTKLDSLALKKITKNMLSKKKN